MLSNSQFKYFNNPLDLVIKSLLIISPLFFISTRGWINGVLFATSLLSIVYLLKTKSFIPSTLTRIQKNRVFFGVANLVHWFYCDPDFTIAST